MEHYGMEWEVWHVVAVHVRKHLDAVDATLEPILGVVEYGKGSPVIGLQVESWLVSNAILSCYFFFWSLSIQWILKSEATLQS
jgi:hypothetical protein